MNAIARLALFAPVLLGLLASAPSAGFGGEWKAVPCFPESYDAPASERLTGETRFVDEMDEMGKWKALNGEQNASATLSISTADKKSGAGALRVDYRFAGKDGLEYAAIALPFAIEKPGCGIVLWVKGNGSRQVLRARISDAMGQTLQYDIATLNFTGWRKAGFLLGDVADHWGGANDGKAHYPCRFDSLLVDRPRKGFIGEGTVLFDRLELIAAAKEGEAPALFMVETRDGRLGNIYEQGEKIALRAVIQEAGRLAGGGKIAWELSDYWDKAVGADSVAIEVGDGSASWSLTAPGAGFYHCKISLMSGGKGLGSQELRLGVLAPPGESKPLAPGFFGACVHFTRAAWPLEALDLAARAGISHVRDEIGWSGVERKKGELEFPERGDEFINKAVSLGIEPLLVLDYANKFYDDGNYPASPEAIAGFARYSEQVARHFKGRVKHYEVWNEYTGGCGMKGKPKSVAEVYAKMIEPVFKGVKEIDPGATIIGIGGDNPRDEPHRAAMARMLKAGAVRFMDAASIHPYRYPQDPDSSELLKAIEAARGIVADAGGQQRLWITEIGWPTHLGQSGVSERVQAQMIVRAHVIAMASQCVDKLFWYDFKDDGLKRTYNEDNFGIIHHQAFNCAPKPAYVALANLTRLLTGATFDRALDLGPKAHGYAFKTREGAPVSILWAIESPVRVKLAAAAQITDIMGATRKASDTVELAPDPIYLIDGKASIISQ